MSACSSKKIQSNGGDITPIEWTSSYSGVWETKLYEVPEFNLLSVSKKEPRKEALQKLGETEFPLNKQEITSFSKNGKTFLRFPLDEEEQIYGLGLHFNSVQQRGKILRLHMDHYGGSDNGRTHAPVPFFISSKGYGVLINSSRYIDVYVGSGVTKNSKFPAKVRDRNIDPDWVGNPYSDNLEIVVPEEGVELILFSGNNMMEVVQRFNLYCGGGFIPPKWGLGFWHRTPTLYSDNDVHEEVQKFKDKNFPLDVIGLEPGWHTKAYPCTFEWDKSRFNDPAGFTKKMLDDGIRLNLWCNPYLWPGCELDQKMESYTGSHTVWCGTVPDYTIPKAQKILKQHIQKNQLNFGISGYKIDEVDGFDEWIWPDIATFPSGLDGEQMRQVYGNLVMGITDDAFRDKNERTYGLVRAANAGSVNYPYVIYNDYYSHEGFITALINSGFNGVLWTPEVRSGGSAEEWIRRMQTVCFSPMSMINAWVDGTKPWSFEEVYPYCQDVAFLRMRLLPYIYSTFARYHFEGIPPFRAINLEEGFAYKEEVVKGQLDGTKNPYAEAIKKEIKDQYMMGEYIMVAPMFSTHKEREVVLPQGNWYDFYTGEYAGNGEVIKVKADLDQLPLFVKDGAVIPMIPAIRQTKEWNNSTPLEIRHYGNANGNFQLYDDDGETHDYEEGEYSIKNLKVENGKGEIVDVHPGVHWSYGDVVWKHMSE